MKDDSRKDRYMLRDRLGKELLYFDGGMGTLLQERGLAPGELPETWNVEHPEVIREIHRRYIEAQGDPQALHRGRERHCTHKHIWRECAEIPR